jgi:hypothetical protein
MLDSLMICIRGKMHNYEALYKKAVANTKKLGCKAELLPKLRNKINKAVMIGIFEKFLEDYKFDPCNDICGNCLYRHLDFQRYLEAFGVETELTIGDVLINGNYRYNTDLKYLSRQLEVGKKNVDTFNAHVWLTLPSYEVIDVVIQSSRICNKEIESEYYANELIIIDQESTGYKYYYKPLLVGRDYLEKTHEIIGPTEIR